MATRATRRRHSKFLTAAEKMRLPNPDEAINYAYAIHKADDPDLKGKSGLEVAKEIVTKFATMQGKPETPEEPYVDSIKPIVFSYAMAIARRKLEYREELRNAKRIRVEKLRQLQGGRISKQGLSLLTRFVLPYVTFFLTGFIFAQLVGGSVPERIAERTTDGIPEIALGLAFAFVWRLVSSWMEGQTRNKIYHEYDTRRAAALRKYERGKVIEYELARSDLCKAWKQYTGREHETDFHYQTVMEGDIELRSKEDEQLRQITKTPTQRLRELIFDLRKAVGRWRKPPAAPMPPEPAP